MISYPGLHGSANVGSVHAERSHIARLGRKLIKYDMDMDLNRGVQTTSFAFKDIWIFVLTTIPSELFILDGRGAINLLERTTPAAGCI